jgi:2-polyprenyl-6-methoxyphenol hydroxylase-like FAD-dependent oxidoreductase
VAGRTRGFANVIQPRFHDPLEGRLDRLRNRFATFGGRAQEYLASLERNDQGHGMDGVRKMAYRPVVLVADAAHASSPMMGQAAVCRWKM